MAIIVTEIGGSRAYGWSAQGGRTASQHVRVFTGDPTIGPRRALLAVGIDAGAVYREPLFSPTEWDYGCFLNSIQITEEDKDGKSWIVTLDYATLDWQNQQGGSGDGAQASAFIANPLNAPPGVSWTSENEEQVALLDKNAVPILNSAGDPLEDGVTKLVAIPVCTITRKLPNFDPNWLVQFKNKTNSTTWMGFDAGTVLCKDITANRVYESDWGWMWDQTITLAFKPIITASEPNPDAPWQTDTDVISAGWATQVLDAGLRQLKDGKLEQIIIDGAPVSSPVCLTPEGAYDPDADPHYLTFETFEEVDFDGFNLPSDLFSVTTPGSPVGGS